MQNFCAYLRNRIATTARFAGDIIFDCLLGTVWLAAGYTITVVESYVPADGVGAWLNGVGTVCVRLGLCWSSACILARISMWMWKEVVTDYQHLFSAQTFENHELLSSVASTSAPICVSTRQDQRLSATTKGISKLKWLMSPAAAFAMGLTTIIAWSGANHYAKLMSTRSISDHVPIVIAEELNREIGDIHRGADGVYRVSFDNARRSHRELLEHYLRAIEHSRSVSNLNLIRSDKTPLDHLYMATRALEDPRTFPDARTAIEFASEEMLAFGKQRNASFRTLSHGHLDFSDARTRSFIDTELQDILNKEVDQLNALTAKLAEAQSESEKSISECIALAESACRCSRTVYVLLASATKSPERDQLARRYLSVEPELYSAVRDIQRRSSDENLNEHLRRYLENFTDRNEIIRRYLYGEDKSAAISLSESLNSS